MPKKSKESGIPRQLERAGAPCLAFANTGVPRRDDRRKNSRAEPSMPLERYGELVTWAQRLGIVNGAEGERLQRLAAERPDDAAAVRARAVELRAAIVRIFTAVALDKEPRAEDLATVNGLLRLRCAVPTGDGFEWDWTGDEEDLDRPLWMVAQSAAELLVSDNLEKVDQCAAKGCFQLFVKRSKRRLWCDMNTCGNRSKGRRYQRYLRSIAEGNRRREAERAREYLRAKAAAASGETETASLTSQKAKERLDGSHPTDTKDSDRLGPSVHNRTVA